MGADGDLYGGALGHLLHAVRRNAGVTCLVLQNGIAEGGVTTVGPGEYPLRPLALALAAGGTFVAQAVPEEDLSHLTARAVHHPGFALVNIRQDYHPDGVHAIEDEPEYDRFNRTDALQFAAATDRITSGVLFQEPERASFEETVLGRSPLVTGVSTVEWDDWERIIYEGWEESPHEPDVDSPDP
jgi:2-oxoglutarate ferredoxin oxidoreductase subunit beta